MIYLDYEKARREYKKAYEDMCLIIAEKEELFQRTQPQATNYDKERVTNSNEGYTFADYLAEKERKKIDTRLDDAKKNWNETATKFGMITGKLKSSLILQDKVYWLMQCSLTSNEIAERLNKDVKTIEKLIISITQDIGTNY